MIMAEVKLAVAMVELRTCKLSKPILKQFPIANSYDDLRKFLSTNIRSPYEDQRLRTIEAKYSTKAGATEAEHQEAKELAQKKSFATYMQEYTVGWIAGTVMGDEFTRFLLVQTEPGQYVLYRNPHSETVNKFKQLFVI
jgi:hypothetical protein